MDGRQDAGPTEVMQMELLDRIEQGLTTVADAQAVERLVARVSAYELVLRRIAMEDEGPSGWLALMALVQPQGETDEPVDDA
jgi:hypothetical protein